MKKVKVSYDGRGKAWSLVEGCSPVSAGCDNCWSASMTHRFKKGLTNKRKFNGEIIIREDRLDLPLKTKKPTVWSVWNDLFHEDVTLNFQADAFSVMGRCKHHTFLVLTKRPELMSHFIEAWKESGFIFSNIWFGVSTENQQTADERIPYILKIPGKKFLSIEPILGEIDLRKYFAAARQPTFNQVICGGETGPNARPCHPDWVRSLRDQCKAAGVPFFFKRWGGWIETENNEGVKTGDIYMSSDGFIDVAKRGYVCFANESEGIHMRRIKNKVPRRLIDDRTHNELVWMTS